MQGDAFSIAYQPTGRICKPHEPNLEEPTATPQSHQWFHLVPMLETVDHLQVDSTDQRKGLQDSQPSTDALLLRSDYSQELKL